MSCTQILSGSTVFVSGSTSLNCEGKCTLMAIQGRPQNVFNLNQSQSQRSLALSRMIPASPVSESAIKVMKVEGNCCWKFYER